MNLDSIRSKTYMDIKKFLPCKKLRRSNRLEGKDKMSPEIKKDTLLSSPDVKVCMKSAALGYFDLLPLELKFYILRYMTVEDISLLALGSKAMRNLVEGFRVLSPSLTNKVIQQLHASIHPLPTEKLGDFLRTFNRQGLLVKRTTCLYATRERLKIVNEYLTRMMCGNACKCEKMSRCISLTCFGKFLHTVIAGWDDSECVRTFDILNSHTAVNKNVKMIVNSKPGLHSRCEYEIRCYFRRIFLDHCQSINERAFWLTRILKPWPMVHQSRLLYILYGPTLEEEILWYELCENTPIDSEQSAKHFGELANALQILHCYPKEWSEDNIISVLDELTSSPDEWLAENVAHLLILCGDVITSKMLISKAINGRIMELSSITTSFCVVCVKNSFSLSYVMTMIQNILDAMDNGKKRLQFFNSVMDMFRELILDMHEFSDPEDTHGNDMYYMVTALAEFTKKIIQLAYKNSITL
ncbi:F-box only protein 47-like isoform X1 [Mytilus galloprovincialis]|uniref:F-box only protein 47-like isoform X1 n=1 Tax=Mytilus galloprovincialis TaxID=29158 RepID=UPI003F7C3A33